MTMVVVTHELGFAREVGDQLIVHGWRARSWNRAIHATVLAAPKERRTQDFLSKVL